MKGLRLLRTAVLGVSMLALMSGGARAQDAMASSFYDMSVPAPDIQSVPVLANLAKGGAKLFYMGQRSGLYGWFIIRDGQIQMIYLTSDKKTTLVGGMFTSDGENVSSKQITHLVETNNDVASMLNKSMTQQQDVMRAGQQPGGAATVDAGSSSSAASDTSAALPSTALSPGERLLADLKSAAGVVLGHSDQAEIQMIAAPGCPNCKTTWKELRPQVMAGKVQVRVIPVYNSTGEAEKNAAAQLLRVKDPMTAWDHYANGDKSMLEGAPDSVALKAVMDNLGLVAKWNVQGYPYIVYRGKDGRIKIVQGKPERMAAILTDLGN